MNMEDFKERMKAIEWREKMNENSAIISGAAVVVTLLALGISSYVVFFGGGHPRASAPTTQLFYDTDTKETVTRAATEIPPLIGSSGKPTLVRAYYFTCDGNCADKKIYFLERYTEKAKAALESISTSGKPTPDAMKAEMDARMGLQLRLPDGSDKDWVYADSEQGAKIYANIRCPDASKAPAPCVNP
jgi:hypothetical protein